MDTPRLRGILLAWSIACLAVTVVGQTRVSLQSRGKPSELEQQVLRLGQEASRPAAMAALLAAGRPAVPLLAHAVERDDALSMPALRVLADLGPVARSAVPTLLRHAKGASPLARAAVLAVAAIGERDSVVFADWSGSRIVELDAAGKPMREVAINGPWCVQVLADDHLLVCCHSEKVVHEIDWQGKEVAKWAYAEGPIWAQRLLDGSMLVSTFNSNRITHVAADGKTLAELPLRARQFRVWHDGLLLLDDTGKRLREVTMAGTVVRDVNLGAQPMAFDMLTNGRIRVIYQNRLTELDEAGNEVDLGVAGAYVAFALAVQRDGTQFFGEKGKLSLRDATGAVLWQFECKSASCVVPRIDVPDRN